jgi:protein-L-isoaspartate(D-aspartate) O-methyltransferase
MRGLGARSLRRVPLYESVTLLLEDNGTADTIDASGLSAALAGPRVEFNSGIQIGGVEPFDDLELWLLSQARTFGLLRAGKSVINDGLVARSAMRGAKTIISGDSFAYRASRAVTPDHSVNEFTVIAHGPDAEQVAATYVELIREWDAGHRHREGPTVLVYPRSTPADQIPAGRQITKRHTITLISWPDAP